MSLCVNRTSENKRKLSNKGTPGCGNVLSSKCMLVIYSPTCNTLVSRLSVVCSPFVAFGGLEIHLLTDLLV